MEFKWLCFIATISFLILCEIKIVSIYLSSAKLWEDAKIFEINGTPRKDIVKVSRRNILDRLRAKAMITGLPVRLHKRCIPTIMANKTDRQGLKDIPDQFDWRDKGVIRPVMYQGQCGGCWAIGIIETMESMAAIEGIDRSLTALSAQQLIDCSISNHGCMGGDIGIALDFLCYSKLGITTAEKYPNVFEPEHCKDVTDGERKIAEYWNIFNANEEEMLRLLVNHGPLVAVVNSKSWIYYMGGVVQNSCSPEVQDHVIQIVGYDKTSNPPYYIIRNSWGEDWGDHGYIKLAINKSLCGINRDVAYFNVI